MSLSDIKKENRRKQAEDYICGLIEGCPALAECDTEMYDLPDWSLPVESYEEGLRKLMKKWRDKYEQRTTK